MEQKEKRRNYNENMQRKKSGLYLHSSKPTQSRDDILSIQHLQSSNSFIKQLKIPKHIVLNVEKGTTIWRGGVDNKTETISGSRK